MVALSTEILAPIFQFGCFTACCGVIFSSDSRGIPRKGPHPAKRTAGAREENFLQFPLFSAHQALENGGMLTVNRDDLSAFLRCRTHDKAACADKRLFIGKSNALFRTDGSKCRLQTDRAGNCCDNATAFRENCRFDQPVHPGDHADIQVRNCRTKLCCRLLVENGYQLRVQTARLLFEQIDFSVRRKGDYRNSGMLCNGNCLPANGTRAAKHGDGINHF